MNTPPQQIVCSHPFLHDLPERHVARLTAHAQSIAEFGREIAQRFMRVMLHRLQATRNRLLE